MRDDLDAQLITDYLDGDQKSLEILTSRYLKPIYGFVDHYVGNAMWKKWWKKWCQL